MLESSYQKSPSLNPQSDVQAIKIQAAVLRKRGGPLKIEPIEMDGPRDDEVLVRLVACGICHTDMELCDQWLKDPRGPMVLRKGLTPIKFLGIESLPRLAKVDQFPIRRGESKWTYFEKSVWEL